MQLKKFSKQRGISLLEVMLSLAIIAIILVMATRYFFVANQNSKVNAAQVEISSVIQGIEHWKLQNADFSTLTLSSLFAGRFIPKTAYVNADEELFNPWAAQITLDTTTDTSNPAIKTTFPSSAICNAIKARFPGSTCSGASSNEFSVSLDSFQD